MISSWNERVTTRRQYKASFTVFRPKYICSAYVYISSDSVFQELLAAKSY